MKKLQIYKQSGKRERDGSRAKKKLFIPSIQSVFEKSAYTFFSLSSYGMRESDGFYHAEGIPNLDIGDLRKIFVRPNNASIFLTCFGRFARIHRGPEVMYFIRSECVYVGEGKKKSILRLTLETKM
jgi:hypothetical protein